MCARIRDHGALTGLMQAGNPPAAGWSRRGGPRAWGAKYGFRRRRATPKCCSRARCSKVLKTSKLPSQERPRTQGLNGGCGGATSIPNPLRAPALARRPFCAFNIDMPGDSNFARALEARSPVPSTPDTESDHTRVSAVIILPYIPSRVALTLIRDMFHPPSPPTNSSKEVQAPILRP